MEVRPLKIIWYMDYDKLNYLERNKVGVVFSFLSVCVIVFYMGLFWFALKN